MQKLQAKGEAAEEELRALEMDVTGKVCFHYLPPAPVFSHRRSFKLLLASWRGARLEVIQVLREVRREAVTGPD